MILPDHEALYWRFRAAAVELEKQRGPDATKLTEGYCAKIGDAVFDGCWEALSIALKAAEGPRLKVIPAAMGTGKSSSAVAFIAALIRATERAPVPCLVLVSDIKAAQRFYSELAVLLPDLVCVWTSDHDAKGAQAPKQVTDPDRPRFFTEDLHRHPVAIVTTEFFAGKRGHMARSYTGLDGTHIERFTIIDEQPKDVRTHDVTLTQVARLIETLEAQEGTEEALDPLRALLQFMAGKSCDAGGPPIERPSDWTLDPQLQWFCTHSAKRFAERHRNILGGDDANTEQVGSVFSFARALASSWAFISRYSGSRGTRFIGYEVAFELPAGAALLDATGDIDGRTLICPWQSKAHVPPANYSNLEIVHLEPFTKQRLKSFLATPKGRKPYAQWMIETIKTHSRSGQKALVVCKKVLIDQEAIPNAPAFEWELEGRSVAVTHWGSGIGSNDWQDAEVVFLFDEFHLPKRHTVAYTQGLMRTDATKGPLATMRTLNSTPKAVEVINEGHLRRQLMQMALRGCGRRFDEHGACGKQKLVFAGDYSRLLNLFPGAELPAYRPSGNTEDNTATLADRLVAILSRQGSEAITTKEIAKELAIDWKDHSSRLLSSRVVVEATEAFGWRYVPGKGRRCAEFTRSTGVSLQGKGPVGIPLAA